MVANAVIGLPVLWIVFALFGIDQVVPERLSAHGWTQAAAHWNVLWPLLPGAAIGYGCLWFWLVLTGRVRGVSWGGALLYGVILALCDVPASGVISGLLHGNPLLGLLRGLAMVLIIPSLLLGMATFGSALGLINGWLAQRWIERRMSRG